MLPAPYRVNPRWVVPVVLLVLLSVWALPFLLLVWSAWEDRKFEQRLRYAGFTVRVERVRGRLKKGGPRHTIFLGHL